MAQTTPEPVYRTDWTGKEIRTIPAPPTYRTVIPPLHALTPKDEKDVRYSVVGTNLGDGNGATAFAAFNGSLDEATVANVMMTGKPSLTVHKHGTPGIGTAPAMPMPLADRCVNLAFSVHI